MPVDHGCRLDDRQGVAPIRPGGGDQDPEPAIGWMQSWSGYISAMATHLPPTLGPSSTSALPFTMTLCMPSQTSMHRKMRGSR